MGHHLWPSYLWPCGYHEAGADPPGHLLLQPEPLQRHLLAHIGLVEGELSEAVAQCGEGGRVLSGERHGEDLTVDVSAAQRAVQRLTQTLPGLLQLQSTADGGNHRAAVHNR